MVYVSLFTMFVLCVLFVFFFFFKQKTAYEMRISDWSSDVCSSDIAFLVSSEVVSGPGVSRYGSRSTPCMCFASVGGRPSRSPFDGLRMKTQSKRLLMLSASKHEPHAAIWPPERSIDRKSTRLNSSH